MNRAKAEKYRIGTFDLGNSIPFFNPLIVLIKKVVINTKNAAPPNGLPMATNSCNALLASSQTTPISAGLMNMTIPCPITKTAESAQKKMMITDIAVIDLIEFFFIINKYLLFYDMHIYNLLLKNNNFY